MGSLPSLQCVGPYSVRDSESPQGGLLGAGRLCARGPRPGALAGEGPLSSAFFLQSRLRDDRCLSEEEKGGSQNTGRRRTEQRGNLGVWRQPTSGVSCSHSWGSRSHGSSEVAPAHSVSRSVSGRGLLPPLVSLLAPYSGFPDQSVATQATGDLDRVLWACVVHN